MASFSSIQLITLNSFFLTIVAVYSPLYAMDRPFTAGDGKELVALLPRQALCSYCNGGPTEKTKLVKCDACHDDPERMTWARLCENGKFEAFTKLLAQHPELTSARQGSSTPLKKVVQGFLSEKHNNLAFFVYLLEAGETKYDDEEVGVFLLQQTLVFAGIPQKYENPEKASILLRAYEEFSAKQDSRNSKKAN